MVAKQRVLCTSSYFNIMSLKIYGQSKQYLLLASQSTATVQL